MSYIPHSTHEDEARFIVIITSLIKKGELEATPAWKSSSKDENAKAARKKQSEKEAKEAEEMAKELGVWDEFYGSGRPTEKKAKKGKSKGKDDGAEADEDHSALQALILKKKQKNMDGFFDSLAAKYAEPAAKGNSRAKGKKRSRDAVEEDESPKKKTRSDAVPPPPEIDDEEFAKLQDRLFGDKAKSSAGSHSAKKKEKGRKAK